MPDPDSTTPAPAPFPGSIGPYRILERIGEGGMGEVFVAEQAAPVKRRVAVKLIKLGMDTREVIARFEGERQALALMNHPNVARIFDAGATELGRPYFVMEYVEGGRSISEYCDAERLGTDARLRLFIEVCAAIQHAHTKGLIHRDIKPGNLLVTCEDGRPTPKVIDFGIAKATDQRSTDRTALTTLGHAVGTPEYMSPEQADQTAFDVDTRSDVYSLGVVLYELLVGVPPLEMKSSFPGGTIVDFLHELREQEPPAPSTRLSKLGDGAQTSAEHRRTSIRELTRRLRGELDWIVMKALAKDPGQRYQSAADFAEDIQRKLDGFPVLASPPSATYRLRKALVRHRVAFGFAATVFVLLGVLATTSTLQARRTAVVAERASQAAERAQREARQAQAVTRFLTDLFTLAGPSEAQSVTAREVLERGAVQLSTHLGGEPMVQAALCDRVGDVLFELGLYESATPMLEKALELIDGVEGVPDSFRAGSLRSLGLLYRTVGRSAEAEELLLEALDLQESNPEESPLAIVATLNTLGSLAVYARRLEEGLAYHERALALEVQHRDPDDLALELTFNNLGAAQYELGRYGEAAESFGKALRLFELQPRLMPDAVYLYNNLAHLYVELGRTADAEQAFEQALDLCAEHFGETHEVIGAASESLGRIWVDREPMPEGTEELLRRGLAVRAAIYGEGTAPHARTLAVLGRCLLRSNQLEEAREALEIALPLLRREHGGHDFRVLAASLDRIDLDLREERLQDADLEWLQVTIERLRAEPGAQKSLAETLELFARALRAQGWEEDADAVLDEVRELTGS